MKLYKLHGKSIWAESREEAESLYEKDDLAMIEGPRNEEIWCSHQAKTNLASIAYIGLWGTDLRTQMERLKLHELL